MLDERILNPYKTIEEAMPAIIEAFVEYYGEEQREHIETVFGRTTIIPVFDANKKGLKISSILDKKSKELQDAFVGKMGIKSRSVLFNDNSFKYPTLLPITSLVNYMEYNELSEDEKSDLYDMQLIRMFPALGPLERFKENKKNPEFQKILDRTYLGKEFSSVDEYLEYIRNQNEKTINRKNEEFIQELIKDNPEYQDETKLKELYEAYRIVLEEYKKYEESLRPYQEEVDSDLQLKKDLEKKEFRELVRKYADFLNPEDISAYQERGYSGKSIDAFLGNLNYVSGIEFFDEEHNNLLIDGEDYQKSSIKRERIEYFKRKGIDHGDNYEEYLSDPSIQEIWPSQLIVNQLKKDKEEARKRITEQYYDKCSSTVRGKQMLSKVPFICPTGLNKDKYDGVACVVPNAMFDDNGELEVTPILYINMGSGEEYLTKNLIHELNHIYELSLLGFDEDKGVISFVTGWDYVEQEITETEEEEEHSEKRTYELLSEIVNERIAQEITGVLFSHGEYVFTDESNSKIKGGTSYESTNCLINSFLNTYKDKIIESRRNGVSIILDEVGEENFNRLNSLFPEFTSSFSGWNYYRLIDEQRSGKETENTRIFNQIVATRDEILESMRTHSKNETK